MISFAYPLFLWGLGLLAVPLLLHLLNRRRPDSLTFPDIRFMHRAQLPQEGRRRLRDIILLLLRMAILAAVVILLARPIWTPPPKTQTQITDKRAVLLIDCSASMSGWNHHNNAIKLATDALKSLRGFSVAVIQSAGDNIQNSGLTTDFDSLNALIKATPETFLAGEHTRALALAVSLLASAPEQQLFIISDFRRADWDSARAIIPPNTIIHFLDCGQDNETNVAISSVRSSRLPNERRRVIVSTTSFSHLPIKRTLNVTIANVSRARTINIPPFGHQRTAFSLPDAPGQDSAVATLDNDDYTPDDSFVFALKTAGRPKALLISDENDNISPLFTISAMEGRRDAEDGFAVNAVTPLLFTPDLLENTRILFLMDGTDALAPDDIKAIAAFVNSGGTLFVTPGPGNAAMTLNTLSAYGLLNAKNSGIAEAAPHAPLGFGMVAQDSSLASLFSDWNDSDLFLFPIKRHLRLDPKPPTRSIASSLDKLPLILETPFGTGKCILFTFGFTPDWSPFPLTASFLPLLRELAKDSVPDGYGIKRVTCGDESSGTNTDKPGFAIVDGWPVEIRPPARESMTQRINVEDLRIALTAHPTAQRLNATVTATDATRPVWKAAAFLLAALMLAEATTRLCLRSD